MRLLLLNPYFGDAKNRSSEVATNAPPFGLGYLATYVRDHSDCEVEVIDPVPQGLSEKNVLEKVRNSDFIGLGCFTDTRFRCFDFAKKAKEVNPDCLLIIGGPFVYFLDKLIFSYYPFINVIVRGEGEFTLLDIVNKKPFSQIEGITYKMDSRIIRNPDRPLEKSIDNFYIDYSLLPDLSLYSPDMEGDFRTKGLKTACIVLSRGCPFQCTYCANDHWHRTWRMMSPEAAVTKIKSLKEQYKVEFFKFYDDLFTLQEDWVYKFCKLINKEKIDIKFRILSRVNVKKEILNALKDAGCISIGFGIESGSDRMLKRINKGFSAKQASDTIEVCKKLKLWTVCSFIISLPDETKKDIKKTLSLTKLCNFFVVNILHIHPGTPLYYELKNRGEIDDDIWFDRDLPTTIHYCKDHFSSAALWFKDAQWFSLKSRYYEVVFNPLKIIKRYGPLVSLLWILFALIDLPARGRLYKKSFYFKNFYRKLLWRN